jgi:hypothetical protein
MSVTIFGLATMLIGIWCQFLSYRASVYVIFGLCILGATAALDLPALGGASVSPANFFLLFLLLRLVSGRRGVEELVGRVGPKQPLFLFFVLTLWIAFGAALMPRLFAGATLVFSLSRTSTVDGVSPLVPTTGNISQAVYAIAGLLAACATCSFAQRPGGYRAVLRGIILVTSFDIGFAVLDLITNATHTGFILDVVHTANYAFLTDTEVGGLKRISGSFSEASSFATFSLLLLGVNLSLYTQRVATRFTSFSSLTLALLIMLTTSSAGYAGILVLGAGYAVYAVKKLIFDRNKRPLAILFWSFCIVVLATCLVVLFFPGIASVAQTVVNESLLSKAGSDSAIERGSWNTQAWQVFKDTYGLGGGIGSTRSSNYALVLLSNTGALGFALYVGLLLRVTFDPMPGLGGTEGERIVWAARCGLLTVLVPSLLIGTVYDLGMMYYCLLGVAASGFRAGAVRREVPSVQAITARATSPA